MIVLSVYDKKETTPVFISLVKSFSLFQDDETYQTYLQGIMPDIVSGDFVDIHFNYPIDLFTQYFDAQPIDN